MTNETNDNKYSEGRKRIENALRSLPTQFGRKPLSGNFKLYENLTLREYIETVLNQPERKIH